MAADGETIQASEVGGVTAAGISSSMEGASQLAHRESLPELLPPPRIPRVRAHLRGLVSGTGFLRGGGGDAPKPNMRFVRRLRRNWMEQHKWMVLIQLNRGDD